ncbi:MAG: hypothetical protein KatS3mg091_740 [Patescibacteria group bacterium]|nr:MAG: hypothetical protein KatS3mg091_740 [Patescibacteria group bacterium]
MLFPLLLIVVETILFFTNYIPNTFLIGWDNIMPEFNLWLNLERSFFSVWQEYRGLGLLDGMSHASNLMHSIYIAFLMLLFPQNMVRYVFIFLTHLLGGIGFYYLAKKSFKNSKSAFIGALFYMFNLGVVQMYSAPLEVFATHFAALPFLALTILNVLEKPNKKNISFLFLASILTSPQTFVPTIFIVFLILFFFILFFYYLQNKNFKRTFVAFSLVIIPNLFWLLPFVYSVKNNAKIIANTRINQYSSEEIYLRNKAFGNLENVLTFKGFMMDAMELNTKTNKTEYLMTVWKDYAKTPLFNMFFIAITIVTILGIVKTVKDKNCQLLPFLFSLFTAFFFLANNTFMFEQLNNIFRSLFPILGEGFRFPFTKFIILFAFCYSIFFSYGLSYLLESTKKFRSIILGLVFLGILYICFPAFKGYFISPFIKQTIPQEYFHVISYFDSIDHNKRIAFLPTPSFWNWYYRRWGHRGSGFLWYGIPQPILLRAFDPWSNYNEQFYNEFAYAQKLENIELFNQILRKYNIDYLLLDSSLINTLSPKPINYDKIKDFLNKNTLLTKEWEEGVLSVYKVNKQTHNRFVSLIYNPVKSYPDVSFYYLDETYSKYGEYIIDAQNQDLIVILPSLFTEKTQKDIEFSAKVENNTLVFSPKDNPFKNFQNSENYILIISSILNSYLIPATIVNNNGQLIIKIIQPSVKLDNREYKPIDINIVIAPQVVRNPTTFKLTESNQTFHLGENFYLLRDYPNTIKIMDESGKSELITEILKNISNVPTRIPVSITSQSVVEVKVPVIESKFNHKNSFNENDYLIKGDRKAVNKLDNYLKISARNGKVDVSFYKDTLPHQSGYIFFVNATWKTGLPIIFYINNPFAHRSEMESKIAKAIDFTNVFVLPPTEKVYSGYGLHFVADPIGKEKIETSIKNLAIYPIPYEVLKGITLEKLNIGNREPQITLNGFLVNKSTPYLYHITISGINLNQNNLYIKLSQSFHPGWKAYKVSDSNFLTTYFPFFVSRELKEHVLVNNWANGWRLDEEVCNDAPKCNIVIIFWPQYLQFVGFLLLGLTFVWLILRQERNDLL